jgi:hypothetical protein
MLNEEQSRERPCYRLCEGRHARAVPWRVS